MYKFHNILRLWSTKYWGSNQLSYKISFYLRGIWHSHRNSEGCLHFNDIFFMLLHYIFISIPLSTRDFGVPKQYSCPSTLIIPYFFLLLNLNLFLSKIFVYNSSFKFNLIMHKWPPKRILKGTTKRPYLTYRVYICILLH